ncbi:hypothetical protein HMPREF2772_00395 [Achromobacter xylosoxidans]|nr:hypothetical protein HMPREF2772_00395 [Achromobacter xylosoxidans]
MISIFILMLVLVGGLVLWVISGIWEGDVGRVIQGGFMISAGFLIFRAFAPMFLSDVASSTGGHLSANGNPFSR